MTESILLLLSLYAAIGVTYLLGRRVWIWYHKLGYHRLLREAKLTPAPPLNIVEEQAGVVLPYEKDVVVGESVEEREYRIEQDFYTRTGKKREKM